MIIAPSLLSADFSKLGQEALHLVAAGADWLHFDAMDGHFVENLTFGPMVLKALRGLTDIPFDAHLMVSNPDAQIAAFAEAGADHILFQQEIDPRPLRLLGRIRALGKKAGIVYNPATPLDGVEALLPLADIVLIMSVEPGAGGQEFLPVALGKIQRLRKLIDAEGLPTLISVDGGINETTARWVIEAGVDVIVSGSWLINHKAGYAEAIRELKRIADNA